jgi:alkylhydroperoxidase family enzyme
MAAHTVVVEKRAWVSDEDVTACLAAGFTRAQLLEVILGVTFKTRSNYTNHIADTPLDAAFETGAWEPVAK